MKSFKDHIVYEDNHLLVINKESGVLVQGDSTRDQPLNELAKSYLKKTYNKLGNVYLGILHRIDRPTSGLILFAKTSKAASRLSKAFQNNKVKKTYVALVKNKGKILNGTRVSYLKKDTKTNKSEESLIQKIGYKKSITHYQTLLNKKGYLLLEISIETGRHHQIRCHLSNLGYPIIGDVKYGGKSINSNFICLHAKKLNFEHPTLNKTMNFEIPLPNKIKIFID